MTKNPFVFLLYTKICFRNITFQFSRSLTKRKNCCNAIVDYFDSFCFIDFVTRFSVFAMLSFSSFDSFPDRRQVVYTVETLEFQKFSRNSEINFNFGSLYSRTLTVSGITIIFLRHLVTYPDNTVSLCKKIFFKCCICGVLQYTSFMFCISFS